MSVNQMAGGTYIQLEVPPGFNIAWLYQQVDQAVCAARANLADHQVPEEVKALSARAFAAVEALEAYSCDDFRCPTRVAAEAFARMRNASWNAMTWAIRELETWVYDPEHAARYREYHYHHPLAEASRDETTG